MKKCYCCGKIQELEGGAFCSACGKPLEITGPLLNRALGGDQDALAELYQRTQEMVYGTIRSHVPNDETAQDLMQETYIKAFRNLNQLETAAAFPGWVQTIARNLAADWYKKEKRMETVAISQLEYETEDDFSDQQSIREQAEVDISRMPAEALDRQENNRLLDVILSDLPEVYRQTLMMRYFDNMSLKDIAREMDTNVSTVKTRLTSAKKLVEKSVYDLEKKGTKIYGLAPLPFLLFLLRFRQGSGSGVAGQAFAATEESASTATASTSAASSKFTAATATKNAGGLLTKTLGIKIGAAILALAVIGGAGVAMANLMGRSAESQVEEALSEEDTSEALEGDATSIIEALVEEETTVEAPTVEEMRKLFGVFEHYLWNYKINIPFQTGELTAAQAVNLVGLYLFESTLLYDSIDTFSEDSYAEYDNYSYYILPVDLLEDCILDLFGMEFDLLSVQDADLLAIGYPSEVIRRDTAGNFLIKYGDFGLSEWDTVIDDISGPDENGLYTVQVTYTNQSYTCTVQKDEASSYGWVIVGMVKEGSVQAETTEEASYDWAALYASYLADKSDTSGEYHFIYLNDDDVPEIYYEGSGTGENDRLYYITNGTVAMQYINLGGYGANYAERGGYIVGDWSRMDNSGDFVAYLNSDGTLTVLLDGKYYNDTVNEITSDYTIDGESVSQAEYESRLAAVTAWQSDDTYDVKGFGYSHSHVIYADGTYYADSYDDSHIMYRNVEDRFDHLWTDATGYVVSISQGFPDWSSIDYDSTSFAGGSVILAFLNSLS